MHAHVKKAEELVTGDWINVNGNPMQIGHIHDDGEWVSVVPPEGGKVVRMPPDHKIEYVSNEEWEAE